jgi:hypothetical protein
MKTQEKLYRPYEDTLNENNPPACGSGVPDVPKPRGPIGQKSDYTDRERIDFLKGQNLDLIKMLKESKEGHKQCIIALKQCIKVLKSWHGPEAFEIYYDNAPEMKLIRKILPDFKVR